MHRRFADLGRLRGSGFGSPAAANARATVARRQLRPCLVIRAWIESGPASGTCSTGKAQTAITCAITVSVSCGSGSCGHHEPGSVAPTARPVAMKDSERLV